MIAFLDRWKIIVLNAGNIAMAALEKHKKSKRELYAKPPSLYIFTVFCGFHSAIRRVCELVNKLVIKICFNGIF